MTLQKKVVECEEALDFAALTEQAGSLLKQGCLKQVEEIIDVFLNNCERDVYRCLVRSLLFYIKQQHIDALREIYQAKSLLTESEAFPLSSLYSFILIRTQLALPRRERPAVSKAYHFYKKNMAALRDVDADLAKEVHNSSWPDEIVVVEFWEGLYLYSVEQKALYLLDAHIKQLLDDTHLKQRLPIAFDTALLSQEILYCLKNQYAGVHGMARAHYVAENEPKWIKALLHLSDLSKEISGEEILFFGGLGLEKRVREVFGTLRYKPAQAVIGSTNTAAVRLKTALKEIYWRVPEDELVAYYGSEEFRQRQDRISRGELLPRVMVVTCRWTTFLRYCAADFEAAFSRLGCETLFLIEESDVQHLSTALESDKLGTFKPDAVFMVSYCRASYNHYPRELPFISYIQDKCGPVGMLSDLSDHIADSDLLVCIAREHQRYVCSKQVPQAQTIIMPAPADEAVFYPLEKNHPSASKFTKDISFVKHGHPVAEAMLEDFVHGEQANHIKDPVERKALATIFTDLYKFVCADLNRRFYEQEMQEYVRSFLADSARNEMRKYVDLAVQQFYLLIYSSAWRCQFLEALDKAGMKLALYGNNWESHSRLCHLACGPADHQHKLNYVYNFSRINLNINQAGTMHSRLSECALAGGFIMVADHPQDKDWSPARTWFEEGKEIVFFDTGKDLIDKCRYYLAHEDERAEIAYNMHKRAVRERTCVVAAREILDNWRTLLSAKNNLSTI